MSLSFKAGRIGSGRFDRGDDERAAGEIYVPKSQLSMPVN